MIKILNSYNEYIDNNHIDEFYTVDIFNNYCLLPSIFEQDDCSSSDNLIDSFFMVLTRKSQCFFGNYLNLNSNISYIFFYKKTFLFILFLIFSIFILKLLLKNKKY
jgi:hypothetical protein